MCVNKTFMFLYVCFSDTASKGGGYLTIEDAQGSTVETFLEEGFLNYLKKVFDGRFLLFLLFVHAIINSPCSLTSSVIFVLCACSTI